MLPWIAINGRYIHRQITGVERYATEIAARLGEGVRTIMPRRPLGQVSGHLWEQVILPLHIQPDEVLWSPANAGPWGIHAQVVTLHDASVFDHPEWFRPAFAAWTRLSWRILAKRVYAVITVSEFSRQRLVHHLHLAPQKVHVILNGVGKPFERQPQKVVERVRARYGLGQPYFLFVGTPQPRKNLSTLFRAWELFQSSSDKHTLVIVGTPGRVFAKVKEDMARVRSLGYLPDDDLAALYAGAIAMVMPSLYEGFELTVLEAMACGTPVIASNTPSFTEVAGEAALLVNPTCAEEIAQAMRNLVEDHGLADKLRALGLERAAQFTWDKSAYQTRLLLEKAYYETRYHS